MVHLPRPRNPSRAGLCGRRAGLAAPQACVYLEHGAQLFWRIGAVKNRGVIGAKDNIFRPKHSLPMRLQRRII